MKLRTVLGLGAVWILLGLAAANLEKAVAADGPAGDPLNRLFGSVTEAFGDTAFLKANSYYHGGISVRELKQAEGSFDDHSTHGHEDAFKRSDDDWIARVNAQVSVTEHRHLSGEETREMLPLLSTAVKLDPHNVPAVLTTAYWLDTYFKKTDEAIAVLEKGVRDNPRAWELDYQLGAYLFLKKVQPVQAESHFASALAKMSQIQAQDQDRRLVWYYLGESRTAQGKRDAAQTAYREALKLFSPSEDLPLKKILQEKIEP